MPNSDAEYEQNFFSSKKQYFIVKNVALVNICELN